MKAYLITSGSIFGWIAILHVLKAIDERQGWKTDRMQFICMIVLGAVAAALSGWAFRCLERRGRVQFICVIVLGVFAAVISTWVFQILGSQNR